MQSQADAWPVSGGNKKDEKEKLQKRKGAN